MKKNINNEEGNAAIFLLFLLGIVSLILLIVLNMTKAFLVGNAASNVAEQAAIAGSSVFINETKAAISEFDSNPLFLPSQLHHGGKTIGQLVNEKKVQYMNQGLSNNHAYIKALNTVLPSEIDVHPELRSTIKGRFSSVSINNLVYAAVQSIISESDANPSDTQIILSPTDWRLEVEATTTFGSIADHENVPLFKEKIPAKGYGPQLLFLENVYE